uniref:ABC2_membrane domain-containing protein n=1 Tax=Macrostomum lignano TaxID=282301 RepID=A0A1I8FNX1_9PLAT
TMQQQKADDCCMNRSRTCWTPIRPVPQIYLLSGYARSSRLSGSAQFQRRRFRPANLFSRFGAGADGLLDVLPAVRRVRPGGPRRPTGGIGSSEIWRALGNGAACRSSRRVISRCFWTRSGWLCRLRGIGCEGRLRCAAVNCSAGVSAIGPPAKRLRLAAPPSAPPRLLLVAQAAEVAELTMNLDSSLSVGSELYSQLACLGRQLESAERDSDRFQPLTPAQLQPALAWWLDRAVYARDRREVEREKAVTIVLSSFFFFQKPFTVQYVWSGLVVVLGIYLNPVLKEQDSMGRRNARLLSETVAQS